MSKDYENSDFGYTSSESGTSPVSEKVYWNNYIVSRFRLADIFAF